MRFVSIIPAIVAVFLSSAASAQVWDEYVNRDNFFQINMPGEPAMTEVPYKTVKGTDLKARIFTAAAAPGSITEGTYRVTVVDYSTVMGELPDAIEQARKAISAKGTVKYDGVNNLDGHREWRLTVETPTTRIVAGILLAANNRLYFTEGETPLNVPPAAQFQASLQVLNNEGVRIRTPDPHRRTRIRRRRTSGSRGAARRNRTCCRRGIRRVAQSQRKLRRGILQIRRTRQVTAQRRSRSRARSTNSGTTISGHLIVVGAREGQFVDPRPTGRSSSSTTSRANKLTFTPIGGPAASWPEVTLELCPGSRG